MKKRKIIATVGPSSFTKTIIQKMDLAGVDIFRINLSHTKIEDLEKKILQLQKWTSKTICIDTEGAQLRTGVLSGKTLKIEMNRLVELISSDTFPTKKNQIPLTLKTPWKIFLPGDLLRIDFGTVIVQIVEIKALGVIGRVIQGGIIGINKGVSIDRDINLPTFTEKDKKAFIVANRLKLKTIAFSFASSGEDVKKLRDYFAYDVETISKIESRLGLEHLEDICRESNAILVDRGDLSREVPIEKIIFAQAYIIERAKKFSTPVYVATNLMESMIKNPNPTRAEIHDIVATLRQGVDGLVLAAETAIGQYPVQTVKMMFSIINEFDNTDFKRVKQNVKYLTSLPSYKIVDPHGGILVQRHLNDLKKEDFSSMPSIEVDDKTLSDVVQITEGTYSPLTGFMNLAELDSVLANYRLLNGVVWTLPILFQISEKIAKQLPRRGRIIIKRRGDKQNYAVLKILQVQKLKSLDRIAKKWFGTDDKKHPGVKQFSQDGEYIISGSPFLIRKPVFSNTPYYELTPRQTRRFFNEFGWHNIVGFHTRNICHRGHEYIQKKALEQSNAEAIFISPVVGKKKRGDFTGWAIIQCYEEIIQKGYYRPYGALLGAFNTYSRYSGPREAVFTAICRKNFGCNYFIIGRDHAGVGNYYAPDASQKIFSQLDIGMKILTFNEVYFCQKCKRVTDGCRHKEIDRKSLSGSKIRASLQNNSKIDEYLIRTDIGETLKNLYKNCPNKVFEN